MIADNYSKILVIGLGKSGRGAVKGLVKNLKSRVVVTDSKYLENISGGEDFLQEWQTEFMTQEDCVQNIRDFDLVVKSPGVPRNNPVIEAVESENIKVIDELELGFQLLKHRAINPETTMIAVTGTNGKTTTTNLIGEILKNAGYETRIAGNVGVPLSEIANNVIDGELLVLEVSSFQLQYIEKFRPKVAVILNITPDHLDWHGDFQAYKKAKVNIFINQTCKDFSVFNQDDQGSKSCDYMSNSSPLYFAKNLDLGSANLHGATIKNQWLVARWRDKLINIIGIDSILLPGEHNLENILAATTAVLPFVREPATLAKTLAEFPGVAHRLERVGEFAGVKFINDSKGTNVEAASKALASFSEPIILIAGGKDKGSDLRQFAKIIIGSGVKRVYLLGEVKNKLAQCLEELSYYHYDYVDDMDEAVKYSYETSTSGDVILLSPGCASWDMYQSFEQRGNHFKQIVNSIRG